jgi:hypothetical protein
MKFLKNNKILASGIMMMIAIAMMASATYAWFVLEGKVGGDPLEAGRLGLDIKLDIDEIDDDYLQPGFFYGIDGLTVEQLGRTLPTNANGDVDFSGINMDALNWGYIKNTGNLIMMIKLSMSGNLEVMRNFKYSTTSTSINDDVIPSDPYAGVPGAITYNMIIPDTTANKQVFTEGDALMYSVTSEKNGVEKTDYYLMLYPNTKLDASTYIDMSTNAGYNIKGSSNAHVPNSLYLDNSYFGCDITPNLTLLATQLYAGRAMADVFGLTYDAEWDYPAVRKEADFYDSLTEPFLITLG